jgi:hypothetical protein
MANVKISNLTAASTPLAGTEVLPIVQSGATVKASIANVQTATYSGGTANGVAYLNGSKVLTTGSALVFDGTNFSTTGTIKGATTIGVGNATPSTSGAGITFPATQSASTDANTLDDYEEGTWTPTDGSGAGITFSTAVGNYTKIGRVITGSFRVTCPSTASSAQAVISGLPFTINNTDVNNCFVGCYSNATTMVSGETGQNTTSIYFYAMGTFTASLNTNISSKTFRGTFTYIV